MLSPEAISPDTITQIQQGFLEALPRIMRVARFRLRHRASEQKQEAVAEVVALSWKAYRDLFLKGRNVDPLVQKIAEFSARRVRSGRRLADSPATRDALSPVALCHDVHVRPIDEVDGLQDDTVLPPDQAAFRVDFSAWLDTLDDRRRRIAAELASGRNTVEVAKLHGVSRGRMSQLRGDLAASWDQFYG